MPYIYVPAAEAHAIADRYQKDIVLIVGWDQDSGRTNIVTWGREPDLKIEAADAGEKIAESLGLKSQPTEVHEDFRRAGEAAMRVDQLRDAISKAVRGIRAEINDPEQCEAETLGKIEMRVDELMSVLQSRAATKSPRKI